MHCRTGGCRNAASGLLAPSGCGDTTPNSPLRLALLDRSCLAAASNFYQKTVCNGDIAMNAKRILTAALAAGTVFVLTALVSYAADTSSPPPACCVKRAYCCRIQSSCCSRQITEVSATDVMKPACCVKRAYCCRENRSCCQNEVGSQAVAPRDEAELGEAESMKPACCIKHAYCCSIKRPCCS